VSPSCPAPPGTRSRLSEVTRSAFLQCLFGFFLLSGVTFANHGEKSPGHLLYNVFLFSSYLLRVTYYSSYLPILLTYSSYLLPY